MNTMITRWLTILVLGACLPAVAQENEYLAGSASLSIEPDTTLVSAALAGYGAPREGRFSLQWEKIGSLTKTQNITALNGKLYAITSNGTLREGSFRETGFAVATAENQRLPRVAWRELGTIAGLRSVTALNGRLYGVDVNGHLMRINTAGLNKEYGLERIKGPVPGNLGEVVTFYNVLYAATQDGRLLRGVPAGDRFKWKTFPAARGIVSLAAGDRELYALNRHDTLWSIRPEAGRMEWTQLARRNGVTYQPSIRSIAFLDGRLYGAGGTALYRARHATDSSLGVHALAIGKNGRTLVLVGVDVCGLDYSFVQVVKRELMERRRLPPAAVLINASHTHFAPVTQQWPTWQAYYRRPDSTYLNNVVKDGIIRAVEQALDAMRPGKLFFSRGITTIGVNRRPGANAAKPYDNTLDVIRVEDSSKRIRSVLFIAGCHPVFENAGVAGFTLSANFPAVARRYIEEHTGARSVFLQGCAGDINPAEKDFRKTGTLLGREVVALLNDNSHPIEGGIAFFLDSLHIPVKPWSEQRVRSFRTARAGNRGDVEAEQNVRWADLMLEKYARGAIVRHLPEYIHTVRIGNWKLVGLSREAVTDYGPAIRAIWPGKTVSVTGYTNDVSSYLPAGWHIDAGVYEGNGSFFWYGQPGIPPRSVLDLVIERIRKNSR